MTSDSIENLSSENRTFAPSADFAALANGKADLYAQADADRLKFWEEQAGALTWQKKWETILDWQSPFAKWFVGGKLNATVSALDRHIADGNGERIAFHFEGEPGDTRTLTYSQLTSEAVFKDYTTATAAMKDVYAKMRDSGLLTGKSSGLTHLLGQYTDELISYKTSENSAFPFYNNYNENEFNKTLEDTLKI